MYGVIGVGFMVAGALGIAYLVFRYNVNLADGTYALRRVRAQVVANKIELESKLQLEHHKKTSSP